MADKTPQYTEEYRREAADLALKGDRPATEVARELGINEKTFGNWVARRRRELAGTAVRGEPDEMRQMRQRMKQLERENEFLKKAAAFFASEQR